jgi:uncharacterized protein
VKVAVHSLRPEPVRLEAALSPAELGLGDQEAEFGQPVLVRVKLTRMQEEVLAQGEASTTARLECARCLEPVELRVVGAFEALYVPETGAYSASVGRRSLEWGDQRVNFYAEATVDLSDEIRQSLILELPLKPLCRPDCAGLCPQCGQNLNQGPCDCEPDADATPWAALRDLIPPEE